MKCLYACGDSWTWGDEIPESASRYYNTWPWFLSQNLGIPLCVNQAASASSNDRIFRKTTNFIYDWVGKGRSPIELMIVVGWTAPERTEVAGKDGYYRLTSSYRVNEIDDYWREYYKIYNDSKGQEKTLGYMINLRMLCKGLGISYYDFVSIGNRPGEYQKLAYKKFNLPITNMYPTYTWNDYIQLHDHTLYEFKHPTIDSHQLWASELARILA